MTLDTMSNTRGTASAATFLREHGFAPNVRPLKQLWLHDVMTASSLGTYSWRHIRGRAGERPRSELIPEHYLYGCNCRWRVPGRGRQAQAALAAEGAERAVQVVDRDVAELERGE
jgi:hypothetical protein